MAEQLEDKKGKWFILDWMDGSRTWFDSEKDARDEYRKDKNDAIEHQAEFDKGLYQFIEEYNNI